jgi:hypothetical protein
VKLTDEASMDRHRILTPAIRRKAESLEITGCLPLEPGLVSGRVAVSARDSQFGLI